VLRLVPVNVYKLVYSVGLYALLFIAKLSQLTKQSSSTLFNLPKALYNSIKKTLLLVSLVLSNDPIPLGNPACPLNFSLGKNCYPSLY